MKLLIGLAVSFICSSAFAAANNELACFGTEPFWDLSLSDSSGEFKGVSPGEKANYKVVKVGTAFGTSPEYMRVFHDNRGPFAVVTLKECSDGMSENVHSHEVKLFTSQGSYTGCCNVKGAQ